jgi:hypothetical protein
LPLRISDQYVTIGDETRPWHIHVNLRETKEARFVIENKTSARNSYSIRFFDLKGNLVLRTSARNSYSIRFFDLKGNLVLRANFVRMYDSSNTLIQERLLAYEKIFEKYGKKQNLVLRATKEIEHY